MSDYFWMGLDIKPIKKKINLGIFYFFFGFVWWRLMKFVMKWRTKEKDEEQEKYLLDDGSSLYSVDIQILPLHF
jgi:hypothetical protein